MNATRSLVQAIQNLDAPLFRVRGLHISATAKNGGVSAELKDATGERIAWMSMDTYEGNGYKSLSFEEGYTRSNLRTDPNKSKNKDLGYGTILRAVLAKAAKDAGFIGIEQRSKPITPENRAKGWNALNARAKLKKSPPNNSKQRNNLLKTATWRPVSAYIMNKLGFEGGRTKNNMLNELYVVGENRKLFFKKPTNSGFVNQPTPKLNAVVNAVFHPARS